MFDVRHYQFLPEVKESRGSLESLEVKEPHRSILPNCEKLRVVSEFSFDCCFISASTFYKTYMPNSVMTLHAYLESVVYFCYSLLSINLYLLTLKKCFFKSYSYVSVLIMSTTYLTDYFKHWCFTVMHFIIVQYLDNLVFSP